MLRPPINSADPSTGAHHRTALSTSFQYSYACSIALAISSTSLPAPVGQVISYSIFCSLVVQNKLATDSGTGLSALRAYSCSATSSGGGGSCGGGGDGSDGSDSDSGGGGDSICSGNSSSLQAQQSSDCCPSCRWVDWGSCCLCNNCFSPAPSPPAPCRSTSLGSCVALLGPHCCCWGKIFSLPFSLSLLFLSRSRMFEHKRHYFVHFPHHIGLKLVLLADKSKCVMHRRHPPGPKRSHAIHLSCILRRLQGCLCGSDLPLPLL